MLRGENFEDMVDEIMQKGKDLLPSNRIKYSLNKTDQKNVNRILNSPQKDVEQFNRILSQVRFIHAKKDLGSISKESREYLLLCDITASAVEFCEEFGLTRGGGFKKFVDTGLELMNKKYAINKFKTYREKIFNRYSDARIIEADTNKEGTKEVYTIWQALMNEHTGQVLKLENSPDKYSHFVHTREQSDKNGAEYSDWVKAQFSGLSWTNSVPELIQFHGEEALVRYSKYMKKINDLIKEYNLVGKPDKIKMYKEQIWKS